jgi:hypothetical protein
MRNPSQPREPMDQGSIGHVRHSAKEAPELSAGPVRHDAFDFRKPEANQDERQGRADELDQALSEYLNAGQGNPETALKIALADLLDACSQAELTSWALDQWTSRGYVRGRASTILAMQQDRLNKDCGRSFCPPIPGDADESVCK